VTRDETIARLVDLQRQVRVLREATDVPSLERTMHLLEMYCHMARWELGDCAEMIPEDETTPGA
jgi:hypothetical protein